MWLFLSRLGLALGSGFASACQGGAPVVRPRPAVAESLPVSAPVVVPVVPPALSPELGPEILLPRPDAGDAEVARVGNLVLRQSHAFVRLLSAKPKTALSAVDLLVFDVLVARHAQQHGIRVVPARVEELARAEEVALREQVASEFPSLPFADYIWQLFGMQEEDWQNGLRLHTAQRLYGGYVLRYLALREDRVQVRFLVSADRGVAQEVADKVRIGADFATLAQRYSEDPTRRDGGLLPPFGRSFEHPVTSQAFGLQPGEVSQPFEAAWGGKSRWFVVFCIDRRSGRDLPFDQVRAEIDGELERSPITELETMAYLMRWRRDEDAGSDENGSDENGSDETGSDDAGSEVGRRSGEGDVGSRGDR